MKTCSILENVPCVFENMYSSIVEWSILYMYVRCNLVYSIVQVLYFFVDISIIEYELLKSPLTQNYFSLQVFQFLLHIFRDSLEFLKSTYYIFLLDCNCYQHISLSLSLINFLDLQYILSDKIATPTVFWLLFTWNKRFPSCTFNPYVVTSTSDLFFFTSL